MFGSCAGKGIWTWCDKAVILKWFDMCTSRPVICRSATSCGALKAPKKWTASRQSLSTTSCHQVFVPNQHSKNKSKTIFKKERSNIHNFTCRIFHEKQHVLFWELYSHHPPWIWPLDISGSMPPKQLLSAAVPEVPRSTKHLPTSGSSQVRVATLKSLGRESLTYFIGKPATAKPVQITFKKTLKSFYAKSYSKLNTLVILLWGMSKHVSSSEPTNETPPYLRSRNFSGASDISTWPEFFSRTAEFFHKPLQKNIKNSGATSSRKRYKWSFITSWYYIIVYMILWYYNKSHQIRYAAMLEHLQLLLLLLLLLTLSASMVLNGSLKAVNSPPANSTRHTKMKMTEKQVTWTIW